MNYLTLNIRGGVGDLNKANWIKAIKTTHGVQFISIQETKASKVSNVCISRLWGRNLFNFEGVSSIGSSGGILCVWNPSCFTKNGVIKNQNFMVISGSLNNSGETINMVNVYAPNDPVARRNLWGQILQIRNTLPGLWILMGDFNDVRTPGERINSEFVEGNARAFNEFISNADLHEYQMGGGKFTYMMKNGDKHSKLDRFLVCRGFLNLWPQATSLALAREYSDHRPIILSISPADFGPVPFKAYNSWLTIPGLIDHMEKRCKDFRFLGKADIALATKLRWIKYGIKDWMEVEKSNRVGQYKFFKKQVEDIDILAESRSLHPSEVQTRADCMNFILEFDNMKNQDLKQKSRSKWAIDGDENSSYFHGIVNANSSNNRICGLLVDGVWNTNPTIIKAMAHEFFSNKYKEPLYPRPSFSCPDLQRLSVGEADSLTMPFTVGEIKRALTECEGDKAPGPDGLTFLYIKRCWEWIEHDFVVFFNEFYMRDQLSQGCASSFIALIPKNTDPDGFSDYRPISLLGCLSKLLSKVLANRLKGVMGSLISEEQTAYLSDRNILDGPLMLNEMIAWLRKSKKKGMLFKIDIEKAFDSLSWQFLDSVLEKMNFPDKWRLWMKAVLSSARASVLINGSPTQEFSCYRGLRQGDPLSPFLFILAMEAFSCFMKKARDAGLFKGINISNSRTTISHFLFADDVIFLGDWLNSNADCLRRILRCFYLVSGLKINLGKCRLYGVGVSDQETEAMASRLKCRAGSFPFKYLGLQVGANMNLVKHWRPILEVFQKRLSIWKAKNLSYGGRITLINSVLNSLPTYYFSLYRAPLQVIESLEKLRRIFLWGGDEQKAKINWVAWQKLILPKEQGGIGLGSLRESNMALLAKWWWRFKNESNGLWRKVIWAIHHNARSWCDIPRKLTITGPWNAICKNSNDLMTTGIDIKKAIMGVPCSGNSIMFWLDLWLGSSSLKDRFPLLFKLEADKGCMIADRVVMEYDGMRRLQFQWISTSLSNDEESELDILSSLLISVQLGVGRDSWNWLLGNDFSFSVKSIKTVLQSKFQSGSTSRIYWNNWIPKKVNFLAWRANLDRLPTKDALIKRNIQPQSISCVVCGLCPESVDHIFTSCGLSQAMWEAISTWCRIPSLYVFSIRDIVDIKQMGPGSFKWRKVMHGILITAIWCIWKARNASIFENKHISLVNLVEEVDS